MKVALILAGLTIVILLACLASENVAKRYYRALYIARNRKQEASR